MGRKVVTLLDGGAAVNAVADELVVGCINCARDYGLSPKDPADPIVQLERYSESEAGTGVAEGHAAQVKGAAVLRAQLTPPSVPHGSGRAGQLEPTVVLIRFKVLAAGSSDWHGFILGARTLDTAGRGGLGLKATDQVYHLEAVGVGLPRMEEDLQLHMDE
eukprot:14890332-Alexandrium_andersonii.AAC.1